MTCCAIWAGIGIEKNWLLLSFFFYCCLSSTQWQILQSFIVTVIFRTTVQSSVINQAFFGLFTFSHHYQDWLHFPPLINTLETYLASAQVLQVCTICFNQILMVILQKRQIISTTTFFCQIASSEVCWGHLKAFFMFLHYYNLEVFDKDGTPSTRSLRAPSFHQGAVCQVWSSRLTDHKAQTKDSHVS